MGNGQKNHGKNEFSGEWNINFWNNTDLIERIVYNENVLNQMKLKKSRIKKRIKSYKKFV